MLEFVAAKILNLFYNKAACLKLPFMQVLHQLTALSICYLFKYQGYKYVTFSRFQ
jgi:hypothetical protein